MKMTCICGHTFRLSDIPRKETFRLYDDVALGNIVEKLMGYIFNMDASYDDIYEAAEITVFGFKQPEVEVVECPYCKRLLIRRGNKLKLSYIREKIDDKVEGDESSSLLEVFEKGRQEDLMANK